GIIGIFVPGLPTTPFLLLSSWLFYNSSKRLHDALHRSKWLGPYLRRFQERKGVGWKTKAVSIVCMWTMISISAFVVFESWYVRLLLLGLGVIGTCSVLFIVPNAKKTPEN
ncbi:YbaN family protein, partial [Butyricimonas sp.]